MGIPFYFSTISRDYDVKSKALPKKADYLCFDYNCLIHTVAQHINRTKDYKSVAFMHKAVFKDIKRYTQFIIDAVGAKHVYIAIDGVPPVAKMVQQRKRRYMSVFEKQYKAADKESVWNSSVVTPGTKFMGDLDEFMKQAVADLGADVTYSSWTEKGEGEHKIFSWLKAADKGSNVVIYGMDADMILLSMLHSEHNITLMRESFDIDLAKPQLHDHDLVDIAAIMKVMSQRMGCKTAQDLDATVLDYVLITFLAGNDFLPPLSFLKVKKVNPKGVSGIDLLMAI